MSYNKTEREDRISNKNKSKIATESRHTEKGKQGKQDCFQVAREDSERRKCIISMKGVEIKYQQPNATINNVTKHTLVQQVYFEVQVCAVCSRCIFACVCLCFLCKASVQHKQKEN